MRYVKVNLMNKLGNQLKLKSYLKINIYTFHMSFKKIVIFLFCILAISTVVPVFGRSSVTFLSMNEKHEVTLTITDAYYTDLDKDEVFDVVSTFYLLFDSTKHHTVKLYVSLILPSGYEFSYKWTIGTKHLVFFGQIKYSPIP